ncbi:MAG: PEGA domain-containing protein [Polyangiaceae bacterium]
MTARAGEPEPPAAAPNGSAPTTPTEPALPSEAEALKARGDAAMSKLSYERALSYYEQAYTLAPTPALNYNRGRALQALARYPEALEQFETFKKLAPPELRARVPKLDELIEEVRSRVSTVKLTCNVAGARVVVAGRVLGTTPLGDLRVNAGRAQLEVSRDGYLPFSKAVTLNGNQVHRVDVKLLAKHTSGVLEVSSPVAGAKVFVDGKPVGVAPAQVMVPVGEHEVVLRRDGYDEARTRAVVRAGETARLNVALDEPPGITSRWWFWTGVGVVVAGGAALTVALLTERSADEGDIAPGQVSGPLLRF